MILWHFGSCVALLFANLMNCIFFFGDPQSYCILQTKHLPAILDCMMVQFDDCIAVHKAQCFLGNNSSNGMLTYGIHNPTLTFSNSIYCNSIMVYLEET